MAKKDKSEDDEMLTTQNAENDPPDESEEEAAERRRNDPNGDVEPEAGPVPTIEGAEGAEPCEETEAPDEPDVPDESVSRGTGGVPGDATESDSEKVEISPDDIGSIEDVLHIDEEDVENVAGPHAAPDANDDAKFHAMAKAQSREEALRDENQFITDIPVIRELKAAFKFLAAQLGSQSEFDEISRNFPNIFK